MIRIVDNASPDGKVRHSTNFADCTAFASKAGTKFKVKAHDLGNGHLEITGSLETAWTELSWSPSVIADHLEMMATYREDNAEELAQKYLEQAARRAKTRVRRLCKAMGADTLLTLTYRANEVDLGRCKADLKEFNRRMVKALPGFCFVAAFERQERGAWHVHMATRALPTMMHDRNRQNAVKVKSYDVIRAVWRSVTKERGGNIDVQRRKYHAKRTAAQIASYIAGYIVKQFADGDKWVNRWTKYGDVDVPPPIDMGTVDSPMALLDVSFGMLHELHNVCRMYLSRWKDAFFLSAEKPPDRKK